METKNINKPKAYEITKATKWLFGLALLFLICASFAPIIFTSFSIVDFTNKGEIGDTIGGTMGPFIAIAGVLLTFLAFYMQLEANKLQREQFEIQLKEDRSQFKKELQYQQDQFLKSQFENQFYNMVSLHKENVNDISIENFSDRIKGRSVFPLFIEELRISYLFVKLFNPDNEIRTCLNEAYSIFFNGLDKLTEEKSILYRRLLFINKQYKVNKYEYFGNLISTQSNYKIKAKLELSFPLFNGHSHQLAHYYRHLFQTVKFVVSQEEEFISYEEKRKYLRILRAQLTNQEQVMLFYNWYSDFGNQWESEQNKYLTDYRMIHNIYQNILFEGITLKELFAVEGDYRREKNRVFDPLFEFQDC